MQRFFAPILHHLLSSLLLLTSVFVEPVVADSIIRIIGDRTTKTLNSPSESTATVPSSSSVRGNTSIRITGGRPEMNQTVSPIKEIRILGDKMETIQINAPVQPSVTEVAKKEHGAKTAAEEESRSEETAEQHLAQRLSALKAEEERKSVEKAEHEGLKKEKNH
jgi:hypothetical protein